MATKKISALTELTTPAGTEELIVNAGGTSKKVQIDNLPFSDISSKVSKSGDTMTGDLSLGDAVKATFGAGNDLQIYHSGTDSYISDAGAGNIKVITNGNGIYMQSSGGENLARFVNNGDCALYYDNSNKLATTSTGVDVDGTVDCTTVDLGNWTVTESAGVLYFATSGTNKAKLDASGNFTVVGDVTAYGTI